MRPRTRLAVIGVLSVGGLTVLVSVARIVLSATADFIDSMYSTLPIVMLSVLEPTLMIACGSAPMVRLLHRCRHSTRRSHGGGGGLSGGHGTSDSLRAKRSRPSPCGFDLSQIDREVDAAAAAAGSQSTSLADLDPSGAAARHAKEGELDADLERGPRGGSPPESFTTLQGAPDGVDVDIADDARWSPAATAASAHRPGAVGGGARHPQGQWSMGTNGSETAAPQPTRRETIEQKRAERLER